MPNAELVEQWNSILKFRITENNLIKPDEDFVFKALISLLELFNYDTKKMLEQVGSEKPNSSRLFKIEFCRIVEKLYKNSDKCHTFCYYDLIEPSPKKTIHLLKCLLNYHLFCNMFREEICSETGLKFEEYKKFSEMKKTNQVENEYKESRANMIDQKLCEFGKILPKFNENIDKLIIEKQLYDEKLRKFQENFEIYKHLMNELKLENEKLRCEVVSNNEAAEIATRIIVLKAKTKEQEEIERVTRESNQERSESIEKLEEKIQNINLILELYKLDLNNITKTRKELKSTVIRLQNELIVQKVNNEKMHADINLYNEKIKEKETELEKKTISYEKRFSEYNQELIKLTTIKKNLQSSDENLNDTLHKYENEMNEQEKNREFMIQSSQKMFEQFEGNILK